MLAYMFSACLENVPSSADLAWLCQVKGQYGPRDRLLYASVLLALLRSLTQGVRRVLGEL